MKYRIQIQQIFGAQIGENPYAMEWLTIDAKPRTEAAGIVALEAQASKIAHGAPHRLVSIAADGTETVLHTVTYGKPCFTPEQRAAIEAHSAEDANRKVTTPAKRFGVRMTCTDGRVYMKDMRTEHWTTYAVRDMSLAECEEVVAHELAKRTSSTYEIIDLDLEAELAVMFTSVAAAYRAAMNYDRFTMAERHSEEAGAIRKGAIAAAKIAVAKARAEL